MSSRPSPLTARNGTPPPPGDMAISRLLRRADHRPKPVGRFPSQRQYSPRDSVPPDVDPAVGVLLGDFAHFRLVSPDLDNCQYWREQGQRRLSGSSGGLGAWSDYVSAKVSCRVQLAIGCQY